MAMDISTDESQKCMFDLISPPLEIWYEILSHLPARSILRFRLVCKAWKSLIEDPCFANLHRTHSPNNLVETHFIVFVRHHNISITPEVKVKPMLCNAETLTETPSSVLAASFNKNEAWSKYPSITTLILRPWMVVDAVEDHGVILLQRVYLERQAIMNVRNLIHRPMEVHNEMVLWNPSIDKFVVLPSYTLRGDSHIAVLGVGHDPSSNSYKVIKIYSDIVSYHSNPDRLEIDDEVCRVSSDPTKKPSWRTLSHGLRKSYLYKYNCPSRQKVRFKGALYWIRWGEQYIELVSFDLKSEVFGSINLPDHTRDAGYNKIICPKIIDDGESLSILVADKLKPLTVAIYVLEEQLHSSASSIPCNNAMWTKRYEIDVPAERFFSQPFQLKQNGDLIMGREGNCYNFLSCKVKEPPCNWSLPDDLTVRWFRVYKESLAFLNYV